MVLKSDERYSDVMDEMARELGFQDFKVEVNPGSEIGQNYLGEVLRAKITGKKNGGNASSDFFLKLIPTGGTHRLLGVHILFKQEIEVYQDILPLFDSIAEEYSSDFYNHAVLHKSRYDEFKEIMIMEDLALKNYGGCALGRELDLEHATVIVRKIGHLHAMSFAARQHRPVEFKKRIAKRWYEIMCNSRDNPFSRKIVHDSTEHTLQHLKNAASVEAVKRILPNVHQTVDDIFEIGGIEPYAVMNHADLWSNNMMFKYEDEKLQDVIFLDYQTPRYGSPVLDLYFFLFTSVDDAVRASHLNELFDIYYTSLCTRMRELKCDPDTMYPEDVFRAHLKEFCAFSLVNAFIMLPVFTTTSLSMSNKSRNFADENVKGVLTLDDTDLYKGRVNAIIEECLNRGILC